MRRIAPVPGLSFFFLTGLTILVFFFRGQIPPWRALLLRYAMLIGFLFVLKIYFDRKIMGRRGALLYHFSPILFIALIYDSLGDFIQYLHRDIDPLLIRIDFSIFGVHPTVWMEQWINPCLTDLLSLAYGSYYFLPVTLAVVLYAKGRRADFALSVFVLTFGYYLSFVGYVLFPAIGPRFTLAHLQTVPLEGSLLTDVVRDVLNALEHNKRDCMPSGHTQIVLMTLYLTHRYERVLFYLFLPIICALILSTVYLRYHYVVDLLAGGVVAVGCMMFGPRLYEWWGRAGQTGAS